MPINICLYLGYKSCKTEDLTNGWFFTPRKGESYAGWCHGSEDFTVTGCTNFHVFCNKLLNAVGIRRVTIVFKCTDSHGNLIEKEQDKLYAVKRCDYPECGWFKSGDQSFRNEAC